MKILVTGSTGFIGSRICHELVNHGEHVVAFHRNSSKIEPIEKLPVEHRIGDLNDPSSLYKAVKGMDAVIHCAAQLGKTYSWEQYEDVTVKGTRHLLDAARAAGIKRFIHTSSVAALGIPGRGPAPVSPLMMTETHSWNYQPQRWQYGYAKYLAELEVQRAVAMGLNAVIVNPSSVFGAGDVLRSQSSVIHMVTENGLRLSAPGGMNVVHIRDVVSGHLSALHQGLCGERYILGGENITHDQFIQLILNAAGITRRVIKLPLPLVSLIRKLFRISSHLFHLTINPAILNLAGYFFYYDLEKSLSQLKLKAPVSAGQTIADAVKWFREQAARC